MFTDIIRKIFNRKKRRGSIDPDEVFLDSSNLPSFNKDQFEGRITMPISRSYIIFMKAVFAFLVIIFLSRSIYLQVVNGASFRDRAENNNLKKETIFANRGIIYDRNDKLVAWNEDEPDGTFSKRKYIDDGGFGTLLGYVKYPKKDSKGNFYSFGTEAQDGVEKYFEDILSGTNGAKLSEVSVKGKLMSQSILDNPVHGESLLLSIDSRVQAQFYDLLANAVETSGFDGGSGVMMDTHTGEVVAITSYPEFDPNIMTEGSDTKKINSYLQSKKQPFLERAVFGLYAPGSIMKPFIAVGVLQEHIIDPLKNILSIGYLSLPNPYNPSKPTIFKDWKAHGYVDMRKALAVSSDVYFYYVGGGFEDQKGLGITKIGEYVNKFLVGSPTKGFFAGPSGTVPSPDWKKEKFNGEAWTLGNTYHSSIGQYGFQVTPLQMVRAVTGITNDGVIVEPVIIKGEQGAETNIKNVDMSSFKIVKEGMRMAVTDGTAVALNVPGVNVAAKTGTAEVGTTKSQINSLVLGYYPYEKPKYAFIVILEAGPPTYKISAMQVFGKLIYWMKENTPEYTTL